MPAHCKTVSVNKKGYYDYFIEETFEAGVVLTGCEIKSVRENNINLKDSFAIVKDNEVFLLNAHIAPYKYGSFFNQESKRTRKLLLNRGEINKLRGKIEAKGYTLIVTKAYFKTGLLKVELALAKGKDGADKRAVIKERETNREVQRAIKEGYSRYN
jgi:SsrA-binding protein